VSLQSLGPQRVSAKLAQVRRSGCWVEPLPLAPTASPITPGPLRRSTPSGRFRCNNASSCAAASELHDIMGTADSTLPSTK
jgi:hypothetical protein